MQSVDGLTGVVVIPTATEGVKGKAQIATQAEVNTGTDDTKFVTSKKLMAWVKPASEVVQGMMKVATAAQMDAGTADDVAATPSKMTNHYRRGNILGVVAQSGGIPTGAIIESGSNANGRYTKYADGTMICTNYIDNPGLSQRISFPAAYKDVYATVLPTSTSPTPVTVGTNQNDAAGFQLIVPSGVQIRSGGLQSVDGFEELA